MNGRTTRLVNNAREKMLLPKNYHVDMGFFTPSDVDNINNYCSQFNLQEAGLFDDGYVNQRKARLHFIERPDIANQWIYDKFNVLIGYYNDTLFDFDLVGYDYMQYAEYHVGGHQRFHTDIRYDYNAAYIMENFRKLTIVMMLSDPSEYDGGEFLLNLSNEAGSLVLKPNKGHVLLFPSFFPHQVNPVTRGVRKTLVTWALGPKFR